MWGNVSIVVLGWDFEYGFGLGLRSDFLNAMLCGGFWCQFIVGVWVALFPLGVLACCS